MQYKSQAVAKPYFIGLHRAVRPQVVFGLILGCST